MIGFLVTIRRFLEVNPDQVIILFDEDYVAERDLQSAFQQAGLFSYLATLHRGQPLPTLGQLIRSGHKVLVFAQKPPSASYPWDMDAFTWIQDTPLGARTAAQFSCRLNRGLSTNPLLMMNDWADVFPPRPSPNLPLVTRRFILHRARQCVAQGRPSPQPDPHRFLQPGRRDRSRPLTQRDGWQDARHHHRSQRGRLSAPHPSAAVDRGADRATLMAMFVDRATGRRATDRGRSIVEIPDLGQFAVPHHFQPLALP